MRLSMAGLVFVFALSIFPESARAETLYEDYDSEYLKVASFFVEPVGRLLEWVVFRPIHAVHHWISPAETVDGEFARECTGLRPRRDCVRY